MAGRMDGKSVIITGAAQGIGAAYARRLASEGANVTIVDLTRIDQAADVQADPRVVEAYLGGEQAGAQAC